MADVTDNKDHWVALLEGRPPEKKKRKRKPPQPKTDVNSRGHKKKTNPDAEEEGEQGGEHSFLDLKRKKKKILDNDAEADAVDDPCWACTWCASADEVKLEAFEEYQNLITKHVGTTNIDSLVSILKTYYDEELRPEVLDKMKEDLGDWTTENIKRHLFDHSPDPRLELRKQLDEQRVISTVLRDKLADKDGNIILRNFNLKLRTDDRINKLTRDLDLILHPKEEGAKKAHQRRFNNNSAGRGLRGSGGGEGTCP